MRSRSRSRLRGGRADVFMEFSGRGNHEERNLGVTENSELMGLLEDAVPSLGVSDLPIRHVLYPLDLDLTPRHLH